MAPHWVRMGGSTELRKAGYLSTPSGRPLAGLTSSTTSGLPLPLESAPETLEPVDVVASRRSMLRLTPVLQPKKAGSATVMEPVMEPTDEPLATAASAATVHWAGMSNRAPMARVLPAGKASWTWTLEVTPGVGWATLALTVGAKRATGTGVATPEGGSGTRGKQRKPSRSGLAAARASPSKR